jgi:hypothetical protein
MTDTHDEREPESRKLTLEGVLAVIRKHGSHIQLTMIAFVLMYLLAAVAVMLLVPSVRSTNLKFRLEFRGAEEGMYPNGTKFSASEIVSVPILLRVYNANELGTYTTFERFKSSIFVMQSNDALDRLNWEYRSKLSDTKLTSVERAELEREFHEKRAALSQAEYSLVLSTKSRLRAIPSSMRSKVLSDVLSTWAETTLSDKGVSLYDISILSSGVFDRAQLTSYDYIIALDLVRSRIDRVISNVDELLSLPGAKVLRTGDGQRSLAELRVRLVDTLDFRLRPLLGMILANGISKNPTASFEFLRTQIKFNELETAEATARVDAVRDALATYVERRQATSSTASTTPTGNVIPQIDESFLNRIVEMTGEANDLAYRQSLVDSLRAHAMLVVPLEAEARYYRTMLDSFQGTLRSATADETALIENELNAIVSDAVASTADVNEIYATLSKDLNPSTILYSLTGPITKSVDRGISPVTLLLVGIFLLLLAFPAVVAGFVIHEMVASEETVATPRHAPVVTSETSS